MNKSTLFLNYTTCVDYGIITSDCGLIRGGSFSPIIEVTGHVDSNESVVVDFSTVKKEIKELIDDKDFGFDHKVWYIDGYSDARIETVLGDRVAIISNSACHSMTKNALKVFNSSYTGNVQDTIIKELNEFLTYHLSKAHPEINIDVKVSLQVCSITPTNNAVYFRYTHGLKNSTSWGCQNIAHGHLSYIDFIIDNEIDDYDYMGVFGAMIEEIDDAIFINKENIISESDTYLKIEYITGRGWFSAIYNKDVCKFVILDSETTVEYIADWFVTRHKSILKDCGVSRVFVSEGLSKGAVVNVND